MNGCAAFGGKYVALLFIFTLLAFVAESQLTQYVQATLQYRQPYFVFYLVHSTFLIIFPIHLLYLSFASKTSVPLLIGDLSRAITQHLTPNGQEFPRREFMILIVKMTVGVSLPGLLWFIAITLSSISDVTAIWNTNAFFCYVISVKIFHLHWEPRRLAAVIVATVGVLIMVYGTYEDSDSLPSSQTMTNEPTAPMAGDILTLIASIVYAGYQVFYKKYAALPSDPEMVAEHSYSAISTVPEDAEAPEETPLDSSLPFGLHPNFLTSAVGACTILLFWIPIAILHFSGIQPFMLPQNLATVLTIAGIALSGVIFNAGFMILLGVLGPIVTSASSLLTIVLVFLSDLLFGTAINTVTVWSLIGSGAIVTAFAVLLYDTFGRS